MILRYKANGLPAPMLLKNYLRSCCGISMGLWRRIKWNGTITINNLEVRATIAMVSEGDDIICSVPEESKLEPVKLPLDIRYEDDYMLIVNKPPGMVVHPVAGDYTGTLGNAIMYYYKETGQDLDFHPVHRLDRNTTGLVMIAKLPQLQNALTQPRKRADYSGNPAKLFKRSYLAIVKGFLPKPQGTIDLNIARHPDSIIQRICPMDGSGQTAITHYQTLSFRNGLSLLKLSLETGRTHQVRVHLASLGYPLIGDDLYGGDNSQFGRQALHACHISAQNPLTGLSISVYANMPADMQSFFYSKKTS